MILHFIFLWIGFLNGLYLFSVYVHVVIVTWFMFIWKLNAICIKMFLYSNIFIFVFHSSDFGKWKKKNKTPARQTEYGNIKIKIKYGKNRNLGRYDFFFRRKKLENRKKRMRDEKEKQTKNKGKEEKTNTQIECRPMNFFLLQFSLFINLIMLYVACYETAWKWDPIYSQFLLPLLISFKILCET